MLQINAPIQTQFSLSPRHSGDSSFNRLTRRSHLHLQSLQTSIFTTLTTTILSLGVMLALGSGSEAQTLAASSVTHTLQQQINSKMKLSELMPLGS
jgi:hypothetical protein